MQSPSSSSRRWNVSPVGKAFATLVFLECLFLFGTAIATLVISTGEGVDEDREVKYLGILAIYVEAAFLYFAFESIATENVFQFVASIIIHTLITMYVAWHYAYDDLGQFFHKYSFAATIVVGALELIYLGMGPAVHRSFGWSLFKRAGIGGNVKLQECYQTSSIFFSLLKLDLFMGVLLVVLGYFYLSEPAVELGLNIGALPLTLAWAVLGWQAIRRESTTLLYIFYIFLVIEPAYMAFKLWEVKVHPERFPDDLSFTRFVVTGSVALTIRFLLILWSYWCKQNFGLGLRNRVFLRQASVADDPEQYDAIGRGPSGPTDDALLDPSDYPADADYR